MEKSAPDSLAALARELGVTPPAITARLAQLEKRLGVRLLNRTTRRLSVTHEGEIYLATGARLLEELQELEQTVSSSRGTPKGLLRVNATFGFGRRHIAPAVVEFARRYPEVEVQLELTDRSVNLADKAFDIGIWFGTVPDSRMVARRILPERVLGSRLATANLRKDATAPICWRMRSCSSLARASG